MSNRTEKIIVTIVVIVCIMISLLVPIVLLKTCKQQNIPDGPGSTVPYPCYEEDPIFSSEYTEEQHIQKIDNIVRDRQNYDAQNANAIFEYKVYIIYGFDDVPEYFLVEFSNEYTNLNKKMEGHRLGYIKNDKYYILDGCGNNTTEEFSGYVYRNNSNDTPSKWKKEGVLDKKLYWGSNYCAYLEDDGKVYGWHQDENKVEEFYSSECEKRLIGEEEFATLADCRCVRGKDLLRVVRL